MLWRAVDVTAGTSGRSYLIVAPHPDDETLGCGALLARLTEAGTPVEVAIVTDGRGSHVSQAITPDVLAAVRATECVEACRLLGIDSTRVHQFGIEEGSLAASSTDVVARLVELIDASQSTDVFVPSSLDWHDDHVAVNKAASHAVAQRPRVRLFEYPVWFWAEGPWLVRQGASLPRRLWAFVADPLVTLGTLRPVVIRPGRRHLEAKRAALHAYRSQVSSLTGEQDWATLDETFLDDFLGSAELFFARGAAT
jgi:LmbE family N-acetylglucosaminyl deacetylase